MALIETNHAVAAISSRIMKRFREGSAAIPATAVASRRAAALPVCRSLGSGVLHQRGDATLQPTAHLRPQRTVELRTVGPAATACIQQRSHPEEDFGRPSGAFSLFHIAELPEFCAITLIPVCRAAAARVLRGTRSSLLRLVTR